MYLGWRTTTALTRIKDLHLNLSCSDFNITIDKVSYLYLLKTHKWTLARLNFLSLGAFLAFYLPLVLREKRGGGALKKIFRIFKSQIYIYDIKTGTFRPHHLLVKLRWLVWSDLSQRSSFLSPSRNNKLQCRPLYPQFWPQLSTSPPWRGPPFQYPPAGILSSLPRSWSKLSWPNPWSTVFTTNITVNIAYLLSSVTFTSFSSSSIFGKIISRFLSIWYINNNWDRISNISCWFSSCCIRLRHLWIV